MYRLAELSDSRRKTIGWGLLGLGFVGLVVAVIWIHYTSLPAEQDAGIFDWIPSSHLLKGVGYLIVFGASQMLVIGALFVWVLNQRMTWARALFASFVTWIELVIIFGMVLGNDVQLSWAAIKDSISMGYHLVMLAAAAVFALQLQKMKKGPPASADKAPPRSPYGRPLVRGEG
jgi:hypothetical protein